MNKDCWNIKFKNLVVGGVRFETTAKIGLLTNFCELYDYFGEDIALLFSPNLPQFWWILYNQG